MDYKIGYKLLEVSPDGRLFPLFIGNKKEILLRKQWKAEAFQTKGFAFRPGIHCGEIPSAPWLMNAKGEYASRRGKGWKRVWCCVLYNATNDYTEEALKQKGKCFREVPKNGFYTFFEKGRCLWYISSDVVVEGIIPEERRQEILRELNFDEQKEFEPYKKAFEKRAATLRKKEMNFSCESNLSVYTDSLLFDTGEIVATLDYKNYHVVVDVTGEKRIFFGDEIYTQASDYPDELIENIKNGHIYDYQEDCYLQDNNWFDIAIYKDDYFLDDQVFEEDLSKLTPEQLKSIMVDYLEFFLDEEK